uniref:Uncharacterized protein n=1 Tax=Rhizophora mucronata TaxID=61149 RepID=A0A2P2P2H7_RHIMU
MTLNKKAGTYSTKKPQLNFQVAKEYKSKHTTKRCFPRLKWILKAKASFFSSNLIQETASNT